MPITRRHTNPAGAKASPSGRPAEDGGLIDRHGNSDEERVLGYRIYGGQDPKIVPVEDLVTMVRQPDCPDSVETAYRNRIRNRASAIRAFCVTCTGGLVAEVRDCPEYTCPLWSFRLGSDPFRRRG